MTAPALTEVVKSGDKQARLERLVRAHFEGITTGQAARGPVIAHVVARSVESPVIKALCAVAADAGAPCAIRIHAMFGEPQTAATAAPTYELISRAGGSYRVSKDARLLEAHEQLVLGDTSVWLGDCMRRDPSKRDAYESYAGVGRATVQVIQRSFDRLWQAAGGRAPAVPEVVQDNMSPAGPLAAVAAVVGETPTAPLTFTRH